MQPYKDPDEFIKALGREKFEERIQQAENSFFFEVRILEGQFHMEDPEEKTRFHREIAKKLCEFSEEVERDNYLQAIADKYFIGIGNLRKLVEGYALQTGRAKPAERPRPGTGRKNAAEEKVKRAQRLLISWIADRPGVYGRIKKYISPRDFTADIYRRVAERMFAELEQGDFSPAGMISLFEEEEEQREAALFSANLPQLDNLQEQEKAFRDILLSVKKNSYERDLASTGTDVNALTRAIEGKKALEELARTHISLD